MTLNFLRRRIFDCRDIMTNTEKSVEGKAVTEPENNEINEA